MGNAVAHVLYRSYALMTYNMKAPPSLPESNMLGSRFHGTLAVAVIAQAFLLTFTSAVAKEPITIDTKEEFMFEALYSEPVYAFRAFPIELLSQTMSNDNQARIDSRIFFEAASKSETAKRRLNQVGASVGNAALGQIAQAMKGLQLSGLGAVGSAVEIDPSPEDISKLAKLEFGVLAQPRKYNADFLFRLMNTEMFGEEPMTGYGATCA